MYRYGYGGGEHGTLSAADLVFKGVKKGMVSAVDIKIFDVLAKMPGTQNLEAWRNGCITRGLIPSGAPDAQKKSMQRSVDRLKQDGQITSPQRGVYIPSPCEEMA